MHNNQIQIFVTTLHSGIPDFFLTGFHAVPHSTNTSLELNALVHVYGNSTVKFQNSNGVLIGDFNADCRYLSTTKYNQLNLVNDPRFMWLLNEDSTTTGTVCAYDRLDNTTIHPCLLIISYS